MDFDDFGYGGPLHVGSGHVYPIEKDWNSRCRRRPFREVRCRRRAQSSMLRFPALLCFVLSAAGDRSTMVQDMCIPLKRFGILQQSRPEKWTRSWTLTCPGTTTSRSSFSSRSFGVSATASRCAALRGPLALRRPGEPIGQPGRLRRVAVHGRPGGVRVWRCVRVAL